MALAKNRIQTLERRGFQDFKMITALLARLKPVGTERGKAGHLNPFCDQYVSLLLRDFFNPVIAGVKRHPHFSMCEGVPRRATITPAACSVPNAIAEAVARGSGGRHRLTVTGGTTTLRFFRVAAGHARGLT